MFEVFITTIVICTLSALVVLTSDVYLDAFRAGVEPVYNGVVVKGPSLSAAAYGEALPGFGEIGITIATIFFALSTILGWAYYGEICVGYIFNTHSRSAVLAYRLVYVAVVFVGSVMGLDLVWTIATMSNTLMALPNLIALIALSGVVVICTIEHFKEVKKHKLM